MFTIMVGNGAGAWRRRPSQRRGRQTTANELSTMNQEYDRQRFDIRMPKELADQLDSISDSTGLTRAEIFRRAVALYKEAKNIEKNNGKVLFKDAQGEMSRVVGL